MFTFTNTLERVNLQRLPREAALQIAPEIGLLLNSELKQYLLGKFKKELKWVQHFDELNAFGVCSSELKRVKHPIPSLEPIDEFRQVQCAWNKPMLNQITTYHLNSPVFCSHAPIRK